MAFAIFDIETRIDKALLNKAFFSKQGLDDEQAYVRYRDDLRARGGDFFAPTLHVPISIAVGLAGDDHVLNSVESLASTDHCEEGLVREFWRRAEEFPGCFVTFNGRRFDFPVLEFAAMRYGIAAPSYFADDASPRSRHAPERHLDLCDFLTNYGAVGLRGGMDLLAKMIGMPGKDGMSGAMVQDYFETGRLAEIHRYCRTDVIQTYFLFLRVQLMRGRINHSGYSVACNASMRFREELAPPG